jgi:DNA-binding CsgD family transcriptional regulator
MPFQEQAMPAAFVLRCSSAPYFRFLLSSNVAVLGRSSGCEFVVKDSTISRQHAEIRTGDGSLTVTDLGSRNGTFVDNLRVRTSRVLRGQVVRFGSVSFLTTTDDANEDHPESEQETVTPKPGSSGTERVTRATRDVLSQAERRVFDLLLTGCPEKSIARRLDLSYHTVHNHVRAIFRRLGVHSRAELLAAFLPAAADKPPGG